MGQAGNGVGFVDLVTAHGVLELSCILVGGAAGLSLGWSIVSPGLRTRARRCSARHGSRSCSLRYSALARRRRDRRGNRANLAEAGLGAVIGVGVALGAVYWGLVLWRGRLEASRPFRRRYALTQAPARTAGGASTTIAPPASQARRRSRTRGEHVERDRCPVDVARHARLGANRRVEIRVGSAGDREGVAARDDGQAPR
jgi:hypothetical protein